MIRLCFLTGLNVQGPRFAPLRTLSCPLRDHNKHIFAINRFGHVHGSTGTDQRMSSTKMSTEELAVMVNGIPGKMAAAVAAEVVSRGLILVDEALTGPDVEERYFAVNNKNISLSLPQDHSACLERLTRKYPRLIVIDYTHPRACNPNVDLYVSKGISFVMGTTGGDTEAMQEAVNNTADVYAVIAPNMGKQIVAFQAMMDMMAREFPGAFRGYTMTVTESHQSTKADTSGTARAVVDSFRKLGIDFSADQIEKIRDAPGSMERMKVPGKFVTAGHAYHTYHLTSPDGTVSFEFQHNVCGRSIYAAGTVDAVLYLDERRSRKSDKRIFSMIDILQSGSME